MSRFGRAPTWKLGLFRCKRDPNLKEPGRQNLSCFFSSIISTTHTSLNGSFHFSLYLVSSFSLLTSSLLLHLYSLSPTLIVISHLLTTQKLTNDFPHVGIFLEVSKRLPRSRQMISHVGKWLCTSWQVGLSTARQGKARQVDKCAPVWYLTVSFDVQCKAGMNAHESRQQHVIGEVNQVLQWVHVWVVHKVLTLAQLYITTHSIIPASVPHHHSPVPHYQLHHQCQVYWCLMALTAQIGYIVL